jgi:hypothetical protein
MKSTAQTVPCCAGALAREVDARAMADVRFQAMQAERAAALSEWEIGFL